MPAKNIVKEYIEGGFYHIYNRGVEKRFIFIDEQDCHVFLRYIKLYLSPSERIKELGNSEIKARRFVNLNLEHEVDLICFALMPNHFHLLLKNKTVNGIRKFMQRLSTAYTMYFNHKYKRVGGLFQNTYKASPVLKDSYLLHLTRYIHNNSTKLKRNKIPFVEYCSYPYFLNKKVAEWLKHQTILDYFVKNNNTSEVIPSYKIFVEGDISDSVEILTYNQLLLEEACI